MTEQDSMADQVLSERAFARTYSLRTHNDAWECIEEYRGVMQYHHANPEEGSFLVAKKLDLPRGRVHNWLEGAQPDPVRALDVAEANGWLGATWCSDIGRAFNILVATIFSSGSIGTRDLTPIFIADTDEYAAFIRTSLAVVGCGAVTQHADDPNRATQLIPEEHTAVLGRALLVLGAPTGKKKMIRQRYHSQSISVRLPSQFGKSLWRCTSRSVATSQTTETADSWANHALIRITGRLRS